MRHPLTLMLLSFLVATATAQEAGKVKPKKGRLEPAPPAVKMAAAAVAYPLPILQENIASTAAIALPGEVEVAGQPRIAKGHPCTLWDEEDLARLKKLLTTSPALQAEFARLKKDTDERIAKPLNVPEPSKEPPTRDAYAVHAANAGAMSDLATMYALTGEAKYGEFCRTMLLAYARNYARYPHPEDWTERRYRSERDGRLTSQFLTDSCWLIQAARGYDLVYNLPSWTADERKRVRDDLFEAIAYEFVADVLADRIYLNRSHNRSAICNCGVLMAGYAADDEKLINYGLYGKGGTKENPAGGVFGAHFGPQCIDIDGMWNEGSMGYQFMSLGALVNDAEMLWRHGIDMYRYRHAALKGMFDSALGFAYPDLTAPSTHDSHRTPYLLDSFTDCQHTFEYAYLRYRDPNYLSIINRSAPHLRLSVHQGPTSVIFDRQRIDTPASLPGRNVNFPGVGYGILRLPSEGGTASLLLEYGPSRSHGHPSKLGIDLYAQGDVMLPDPGVAFPYYTGSLNTNWYWTSAAHNLLVVDEKTQIYSGNYWKYRRTLAEPDSQQTVYGPAETMGLERAFSNTVYPGVAQDRALFFTPHYVADLYAATSSSPHKYDMAWHIRGELATGLPLTPTQFPEPVETGYNALTDIRHAAAGQRAWSVSVARSGHAVRLLAAAGPATEVIVGKGYYRMDHAGPDHAAHVDDPTPAIFERRVAKSTVYGNVVDFSDAKQGYVRSVVQEGGPEAGFGLLTVETGSGTDLCFVAYRPGMHQAGRLQTDAQQALVLGDGESVRALYLGGGTTLQAAGVELSRKTSGLASVECLPNGTYLVANPSPKEATITVKWPALSGLASYEIDAQGRRCGPAVGSKSPDGRLTVQLKAGCKLAFSAADKRGRE